MDNTESKNNIGNPFPNDWPTQSEFTTTYEEYTKGLLNILDKVREIDAINLIPPYEWLWPATLSNSVARVHAEYWEKNRDRVQNGSLQHVRRVTIVYAIVQLIGPLHDGIWKSTKFHCHGQLDPEEWIEKVARNVKPRKCDEGRYKRFIIKELNGNRIKSLIEWNRKIAKYVLKNFEKLHTQGESYYLVLRSPQGKDIYKNYQDQGGHVESVIYQNGECMMGIKRIPADYDDNVKVHYYCETQSTGKAHLIREKKLRDELVKNILQCENWRTAGRIRDLVAHIE